MSLDFGNYQILAEIGRGGMGIVYQALDVRNQKLVAIKQLVMTNIDPVKEKEFRDRFRREAATAAKLHHPNIVDVFEIHTENNNYFYVMEFLEGRSLRVELEERGGRLTPLEYLPILDQVAKGLSFAHSMNVVHRDVKPDNIFLLKDGRVKITDFGIARAADFEQTHLTKTGVMMGTLAYVSPEQLQDAKNVDNRADIFSLGIVTYESLSGILPFTGDGIAQTIVKIVSQEEKPLHIVCSHVNLQTSSVVTKAMRKRARERYRSIADFAKEYRDSLLGETDDEITTSIPELALKYELHLTEPDSSGENKEIGDLRSNIGALLPTTDPGGFSTSALSRFVEKRTPPGKNKHALEAILDPVQPPNIASAAHRSAKEQAEENTYGGQRSNQNRSEIGSKKPVLIFTKQGKSGSPLREPAVITYKGGRVFLADIASREVHIFSFEGRWLCNLTTRAERDSKTNGGTLTKPSGIAVDDKGKIYIVDSSDPYIRIFDSKGSYLKEFCNIQGKDGGIQGIAIDSTGLIYLSDLVNGCIQVVQAELGLWMRAITDKNLPERQMRLPSGLATDRLNQIYCVDYGSSKIFVFNKNGSCVRSFGGKGTGHGLFNVPRSVAVDNNDKIYVLDSLNHRIQVFGPTGDFYYAFGGKGADPGKFMGASDLSIDPINNLLYVADKGNQRVQVFELSN